MQLILPCAGFEGSYRDNRPSARMILANGGRLESELALDDGHIVQRYLVGSPLDPG